MKTLTLLLIATALSGCAGMNGQKFADSFADGLRSSTAPNQQPYTPIQTKRVDFQCTQLCQKQGMDYAYCTSKCSY